MPTFTPPPALTLYQASRELTHTLAPEEGQRGLSDMSSAYGTVDVLEVVARGASRQLAHIGSYIKNQSRQDKIISNHEFGSVDVAGCVSRSGQYINAATYKLARAASDLSGLGDALAQLATRGGPLRNVADEQRSPEIRSEQNQAHIVAMWCQGETETARLGFHELSPDELRSLATTLSELTSALNEASDKRAT